MVLLVAIPILVGLAAWLSPSFKGSERIHTIGSFLFLLVGIVLLVQIYQKGSIQPNSWLYVDAFSGWLLSMIILIGFLSSIYSIGYFREEHGKQGTNEKRYKRYYLFFHLFIATMILVAISNNLGIVWVALELSTLVSAVLVAHEHSGTSLEAAWKYFIIGSVGIAFAFIGMIFLYGSSVHYLGKVPPHFNGRPYFRELLTWIAHG
ncbi:proton-conducting transporter membrane subunit [Tepidibacillus marianensis]|uniref:proton-conducting transporter transmembrane domain-containing protein n=1 Tax=Tepidibacillus marianensis TaxID=3131995 RepID=UPI0030CDF553